MGGETLDHWKQLAEELGAEIPPEEPERPATAGDGEGGDASRVENAAASEPLATPPAKATLPPRPAPPRRTASDWSRLAEELGIEVPPEPEPEPTPVAETVATEDKAAPRFDDLPPRRSVGGEPEPRREESRRRPEERDREEDRGGHRRRRRRRRPSEDAEGRPLEPAAKSESLVEDEDQDLAFDDEELMLPEAEPSESDEADEFVGEAESVDTAAVEAPDQRREGDGGRGRGKRRRRRKSAAARRQSPASASDLKESPPERAGDAAPATPERASSESLEDELDTDDAEFDDEEAGHDVDKSLHRAIPSWYEAVNLVVSANLESRAKNPDRKGSGRPRGGQDRRGRDRNRPNS